MGVKNVYHDRADPWNRNRAAPSRLEPQLQYVDASVDRSPGVAGAPGIASGLWLRAHARAGPVDAGVRRAPVSAGRGDAGVRVELAVRDGFGGPLRLEQRDGFRLSAIERAAGAESDRHPSRWAVLGAGPGA